MEDTEIADLLEEDDGTTEEEEFEDYGEGEEEQLDDAIEEAEEETEVPLPAPRTPPAFAVQPLLSAEDREYAEAIFTPQQLNFIEGFTQRHVAAAQQSYVAATSAVESTLADASVEYRRMVVPRMNAVISRMPYEQRGTPQAADAALIWIISEEAIETGEPIVQVMARHLQMRGGTAPVKAKTAIAAKPAATRAPSPSNAGRGTVVRSSGSGPSSNTKLVAQTMGITVREAEAMGLG